MTKNQGTKESQWSRQALARSFTWAPMQSFGSARWTGAGVPQGIPPQHWTLFDAGSTVSNTGGTGSFEDRVDGWEYNLNSGQGNMVSRIAATGGALRSDQRFPWCSDLCVHLHDAAGSGLVVELLIEGFTPTWTPIKETIKITSSAADMYARTEFAFGYVTKVKLEKISGHTNADYLEIGFDERDLTNAAEADRKIGIPFGCATLDDVQVVKLDATDMGTSVRMANNARGIYALDIADAGAVFDHRDNSIIVNTATELTRSHTDTGNPTTFTLESAPNLNRHVLLFQVDPLNPSAIPNRAATLHNRRVV